MLRHLACLIACLSCALASQAQQIGDSTRAVENALGRPQMSRTSSSDEVWLYENGVRITFRNGVVAEVEGLEITAPATSASSNSFAPASLRRETATVVPEAEPLAPGASIGHEERAPASAPDAPRRAGLFAPLALFAIILGVLVSLICQILILIQAFRTSLLWGFGSLFIPLVSLIFIITHWSDVKKPVLVNLGAAGALLLLGYLFAA